MGRKGEVLEQRERRFAGCTNQPGERPKTKVGGSKDPYSEEEGGITLE